MSTRGSLCSALLSLLLFPATLAAENVIHIPYNPASTDDTARLQLAFDSCNAPNLKCTIKLDAGTYLTRQLMVENFHGAFVGAGMHQTILKALPDFPMPENLNLPVHPTREEPWAEVLHFDSGIYKISDMTIRVDGFHPTTPTKWLPELPPSYFMNSLLMVHHKPGMPTPDARVERVRFAGAVGDTYAWFGNSLPEGLDVNLNGGIFLGSYFLQPPMEGGRLVVEECEFEKSTVALNLFKARNVHVRIGTGPNKGNRIVNTGGGIEVHSYSNSEVILANNTISTFFSPISVLQSPFRDPEWGPEVKSRYLIMQNDLKTTHPEFNTVGLHLVDVYPILGEPPRFDAVVANNTIQTSSQQWPLAFEGVVGLNILNNTITGAAQTCLSGWSAAGNIVAGNSVLGCTPKFVHIGLYEGTKNNIVNGVERGASTLDLGVNNKFNGPGAK